MIEKILARLEAEADKSYNAYTVGFISDDRAEYDAYTHAIQIVQEVAKEYGKDTNVRSNGWIPVEVALPKEAITYEVTCEIILCSEKQYITTYALWGTDGEWLCRKNERVIAWKEKSAPYQKGE